MSALWAARNAYTKWEITNPEWKSPGSAGEDQMGAGSSPKSVASIAERSPGRTGTEEQVWPGAAAGCRMVSPS